MALVLEEIPGGRGYSIFGQEGGKTTPVRMFYRTETQSVLTGDVDTGGSASDTLDISGITDARKSLITPGTYVRITTAGGSPVNHIVRVGAVTSGTLKMLDPVKDEFLSLNIPSLSTMKIWELIDLGETDDKGVKIKFSEKVVANKQAGYGEGEANHFASGSEVSIEASMNENSLERVSTMFPGLFLYDRDADGNIIAGGFGPRIGYNYKANARQLSVIGIKDGALSDDPRDRIDVFLVAFKPEVEQEMNPSAIANIKVTGYVYQDKSKKKNGRPLLFAFGYEDLTLDS